MVNQKYELKTKNGYDFFEVSSAFQKEIRRGDELKAMFWAVELYNSNYDQYLWKRIKIITSEDIGLAEPQLIPIIRGLYENYMELKKLKDDKHKPERLFLTQAVIMLCRAKKSRLIDWALIYYWNSHNEYKEIPDYAFDMHNIKGKTMGRGIEYFFNESTKLNNHNLQIGEADYKEEAFRIMKGQDQLFD